MRPAEDFKGFNANVVTYRRKMYGKSKEIDVCNNIIVLDTEVTSLFNFPDGWDVFRPGVTPDEYKEIEKGSLLYIWQLGVDDVTYYGRDLTELKTALEKIAFGVLSAGLDTVYIYVHNLGYEFQFLRNIIDFTEVFARKPRKPIYAVSEIMGVKFEFRCSLFLTNLPLSKVAENFDLAVSKKTGDLDYNILRTPLTPLSATELGYCESDVAVVRELIKQMLKSYKTIDRIPLTSTGRIRRVVKSVMFRTAFSIRNWTPDAETFIALQRAFCGGYTHANKMHVGQVCRDVKSYDFTSSYPAQMVLQKYPMSKFYPDNITDFVQMSPRRAYILSVTFYNIRCKRFWEYISGSKCLELAGEVLDNGRVVSADVLHIYATEVDVDIILKDYEFESYTIDKSYSTIKGYLPKCYIDYVSKLYNDKTKLKGDENQKDRYRLSKSYLNGLYGMCVTNTITDTVTFNNEGDWELLPLSFDDILNGLTDMQHKAFLYYPWGVWVTAYSRAALWTAILEIDYDAVYCDTDSIKYMGNHDDFFEQYNADVKNRLAAVEKERGYAPGTFSPLAPDGSPRTLGVFDFEGTYDKFITLGAKKYAYEKHGKCAVTVSGLSSAAPLERVEDFVKGKVWGYDTSGRTISTYLSEMPEITVTDPAGQTYTSHQRYGINLMPTTYKLGIAPTFEDFCEVAQGKQHTKLSAL